MLGGSISNGNGFTSRFAYLTPLNLPKRETSDSSSNVTSMLCPPPLEGLGEVKTKGILQHKIVAITYKSISISMLKQQELVKSPEYWLETIQNEIYHQVAAYLKENQMTQSQLAIQLGVSKGYISQVMKGEFNYTLKKLIELSLAVGKAPVLSFMPLLEEIQTG